LTEHTSHDAGAAGLGHEVKLLVDMVVERSAPWLERVKTTGPDAYAAAQQAAAQHAAAAAEHAAHGQQCLAWCPICTTVNVARGQPPEFTARAFEQAAQLIALLRAVLADRWHPEQGVHMPGFEPEPGAQPPRRDAPNATFGTSNVPNAAFGTIPGHLNGRTGSSSRVQHFQVRKAEPGERQP